DVPPTRLFAAVSAADRFLTELPSRYSVGLVPFGSSAFVAVPPTRDRDLIRQELAQLRTGEGTAIGDAIVLSARLGRKQKAQEGIVPPTTVLVISDGARDGGRVAPLTAAREAKALGVPFSTALVGTSTGVVTAKLTGGYTAQIRVPASPGTLQQIARTSGGTFYRARTPQALAGVYRKPRTPPAEAPAGVSRKPPTRLGHTTEDRQIPDLFAGGAAVLVLVGSSLSFL